MGLGNHGSSRTYLNIKEGKIAIRKGDQVEYFGNVSGYLTGIDIKDGKFGKELHLTLNDDGETYVLQTKFDGGYARGFMMAIKNADLRLPMVLVPKYEVVGDKKKSTMFINQDGTGIKWYWTKDNPGDLPQMTSREWKGKTEWDNTAQMEYLEKMILEDIKPKLSPARVGENSNTPAPAEQNNDDLPF